MTLQDTPFLIFWKANVTDNKILGDDTQSQTEPFGAGKTAQALAELGASMKVARRAFDGPGIKVSVDGGMKSNNHGRHYLNPGKGGKRKVKGSCGRRRGGGGGYTKADVAGTAISIKPTRSPGSLVPIDAHDNPCLAIRRGWDGYSISDLSSLLLALA